MTPIYSFAAALALTTSLSGASYAATKVGVIGAANPQVYVQREDGSKQLLKVGDEIFLNDTLSTDGKGSAQLMFLDKSALTISPESAVKIDVFVYDPAAQDGSMTVSGAKGAFRFIGGALTKKKAVNLKTPVSTIGIRGGIVDTHIAAGGETDAVFLFGKEMTMTNAQGQTTSTTQFGSGIGLDSANAVPTSLPANVVAGHIAQSPSQAAVAAAPPASAEQINAVEGKVNIDSQSKAAEPAASGGESGSAPATSSSTEASANGEDDGAATTSPSESGGNGDASGGGSDGGSNTNDDGSGNTPPANSGSEVTAGDSANAASPATPAAATNNETNAGAPAPEIAAPSPTNLSAPSPANAAPTPLVGGLSEGAGMKPMAMVAAPVAPVALPAATGSETFYGKVNQFVNAPQPTSGETRKLFNVEKIAATPASSSSSAAPIFNRLTGQPQPLTPLPALAPLPPIASNAPLAPPLTPPNAPLLPPVTTVTPPPPPPPSNGGAGTTLPWHQLAQAPTQSGRFVHRDNNGNSTPQSDDAIELSYAASYKDGNTLKVKLTQTAGTTGGYGSALSAAPTDDSRFVLATIALPSGSGLEPLYGTEITATDKDGVIAIDSLSGSSYVTADESFIYAQAQWIDQNGTIGNYADDSTEYLRGYVLSSLMDGVSDTATAQSAYTTMLTNAAGYAGATSGIIEYDFLPDLMTTSNDGKINYNRLSGFGTSTNSNGLFVDYTNKKFLGGNVVFSSASPSVQMLFGSVNESSAIGFDTTLNQITGKALDGAFFTLNQSSAFNATNNSQLAVEAKAGNLASGLDANDAIEALIVETHTTGAGASLQSQQAAVIGSGATAGLLDSAPTNDTVKGFTAGLITNSTGDVSRIKSASINDVSVTTGVTGDAIAAIKYYNVDSVGGSFDGSQKTINFGSTNSASPIKDAALQKDLYAAEVNNVGRVAPGSTSKGAIVSMHNAVSSQANLVCSTCAFAHWGVWQADHINGTNGPIQQSALVPYVAGQITTDAQLSNTVTNASTHGITNVNAVTYSGDIAANKLVTGTGISNVTGQFEAVVDLANRRLTTYYGNAGGTEFGFNTNNAAYTTSIAGSPTIAASTHASIGTSASNEYVTSGDLEGYNFNNATGQFHAPVVGVGAAAAADVTGAINGTLYGATAQEMGGNFYVKETGANGAAAGGIFLGKR